MNGMERRAIQDDRLWGGGWKKREGGDAALVLLLI